VIGIGAQHSTLEIARLTRWQGERRVARALLGLAGLSLLALLLAPWRQNAVGTGEVIAFSPNERELLVQAPVEGRVARWHFQEGDQVEHGEVIVELADNDPRVIARYENQRDAVVRRVDAAARSVEASRDRIVSLRTLRERALISAQAFVRVAENDLAAAERELEAAQAKAAAAAQQRARIRTLASEGLESERSLELARRNAIEAEAGVQAARAKVDAAMARRTARQAERDGRIAELDAKLAEARDKLAAAESKEASGQADLADVERALARQRSLDVRAPREGMLTEVIARESSAYVKQGERLAKIVPTASTRAVELFVSGNDAPLVVPNQPVQLQFEGWPAIQFGGWPQAAVGTFAGRVAFVDAQATPQGRFRVVVRPGREGDWPKEQVLRQGNAVFGWVLLNRVTLGYELWRQLNGFPPDLPPRAAEASGYGGK
jgi:multidrug efflux pump subunit AcrA (membrane-fusion protein)